jgi:hypothetical protein
MNNFKTVKLSLDKKDSPIIRIMLNIKTFGAFPNFQDVVLN